MNDRLSIRLAAGSGPTFGVDDLACAAATFLGCWEDENLDVKNYILDKLNIQIQFNKEA